MASDGRPDADAWAATPPPPSPDGDTPPAPAAARAARLAAAESAQSEKMLTTSYWATAAASAVAGPLCVRRRSLGPLIALFAGGSAVDFAAGNAAAAGEHPTDITQTSHERSGKKALISPTPPSSALSPPTARRLRSGDPLHCVRRRGWGVQLRGRPLCITRSHWGGGRRGGRALTEEHCRPTPRPLAAVRVGRRRRRWRRRVA